MAARTRVGVGARPKTVLVLTLALVASLGAAVAPNGPAGAAASTPSSAAQPPAAQAVPAGASTPAAPARPPVSVQAATADPASLKTSTGKVDEALRPQLGQRSTRTTADAPARVAVEVVVDNAGFAAAEAAVKAHGGTITGQVPGSIVQADVPASALDALAEVAGVQAVRRPVDINIVPEADLGQAGSVGGEPVSKTLANQWHAAGITGAGVNVGIIDVFDPAAWNTAAASGDLPAAAATPSFCLRSGAACNAFALPFTSRHGNAVAEIVHDMAPGAGLRVAYVETTSDLRAAIDWLASQGVTIVNRSQGAPFDGPGNGTGPLGDVAAYAAAKGITFFNSAGNAGGGAYWRGSWSDPDGDGFLNFNGGDELLGISVNGCGVALGMRWSDWGPAVSRTDYDVYVDNGDGVINGSDLGWELNQQAGAPPIEMAGGLVGSCDAVPRIVNVAIRLFAPGSGTAGDVLELMMNGNPLEYWSTPFSGTQPISDSANPGVVSVGAIDPWNGPNVAPYSSQGPTNDGRPKPDLSAPSCFSTVAYGASCFNGTSAASPVAAGAGALVRQAGMATDAATVRAFLTSTATDRGAPGVDNATGWGEVTLPARPSGSYATGRYLPVTPFRLFDTRFGQGEPGGKVSAGNVVKAAVLGQGGIPATGVTAVVVNVTATDTTVGGFLQVYPHAWATIGGASNLNVDRAGQTVAGLTVVPVGLDGRIAIYDQPGSHVIVDVFGYFAQATTAKGGRYRALDPARLFDTRFNGIGKVPVGGIVTVPVAGLGGVPASGASAVVLNLAATQSGGSGFFQVLPGLSGTPWAWSNLNLAKANQTIANLVVVPLDASGVVRIYSQANAHLIVDVMGYVTNESAAQSTSGLFKPVAPVRLRDTRATGGPVPAHGRIVVDPTTNPALSGANASALFLNVTATGALGPGFVQVYPTGAVVEGRVVSNLNVDLAGQTVPNAVVATLGSGDRFTIYTEGGAHLLADLAGWFSQ